MRKIMTCLAIAGLAGCQAVGTAMEYKATTHQVAMADDTYRVFEHPKGDRIMTTPSIRTISGQAAAKTATLGLARTLTPYENHKAAARRYLDQTGRAHCAILRGDLVMEPQYEFFFDCKIAPPE